MKTDTIYRAMRQAERDMLYSLGHRRTIGPYAPSLFEIRKSRQYVKFERQLLWRISRLDQMEGRK